MNKELKEAINRTVTAYNRKIIDDVIRALEETKEENYVIIENVGSGTLCDVLCSEGLKYEEDFDFLSYNGTGIKVVFLKKIL